jgi:mono/diheme cytochrome c family protein
MKSSIRFGLLVVLIGLAVIFWTSLRMKPEPTPVERIADGALVAVTLPDRLSQNARAGKLTFDEKCAACHGQNAAGQEDVAPPLVHKIYEPNHHGDESFQQAALKGVRRHHWQFGDMPPVEGITRGDIKMIVAYIRELQIANGIN